MDTLYNTNGLYHLLFPWPIGDRFIKVIIHLTEDSYWSLEGICKILPCVEVVKNTYLRFSDNSSSRTNKAYDNNNYNTSANININNNTNYNSFQRLAASRSVGVLFFVLILTHLMSDHLTNTSSTMYLGCV